MCIDLWLTNELHTAVANKWARGVYSWCMQIGTRANASLHACAYAAAFSLWSPFKACLQHTVGCSPKALPKVPESKRSKNNFWLSEMAAEQSTRQTFYRQNNHVINQHPCKASKKLQSTRMQHVQLHSLSCPNANPSVLARLNLLGWNAYLITTSTLKQASARAAMEARSGQPEAIHV